jgi:sterol 3beta-glucosyltransferase
LAFSFAALFPEKMICAMVLPVVHPTKEFANPAFSGISIPFFFNRLSYKLTGLGMAILKKPIGRFRESIGLSREYKVPETLFLYGISEHFLSKPKDYPQGVSFGGFWFGESDDFLSDDLLHFIQSGSPPLLITFGSMPFELSFDFQSAIIHIIERFNTRVLVVKGWGIDDTERFENNSNIKVIASAPFEKLFPFVKAIVHHGGIGTTAECLRAGKPFMVCQILHPMGDQMFWGKLAFKKGVAVKPIPLSRITEKLFLESVEVLLFNQPLYDKAQEMQQLILSENGLDATVNEIEQYAASFI